MGPYSSACSQPFSSTKQGIFLVLVVVWWFLGSPLLLHVWANLWINFFHEIWLACLIVPILCQFGALSFSCFGFQFIFCYKETKLYVYNIWVHYLPFSHLFRLKYGKIQVQANCRYIPVYAGAYFLFAASFCICLPSNHK